jgi:hypothetical protein
MEGGLAGKVIVIAGAAGIGSRPARRHAAEGAALNGCRFGFPTAASHWHRNKARTDDLCKLARADGGMNCKIAKGHTLGTPPVAGMPYRYLK